MTSLHDDRIQGRRAILLIGILVRLLQSLISVAEKWVAPVEAPFDELVWRWIVAWISWDRLPACEARIKQRSTGWNPIPLSAGRCPRG